MELADIDVAYLIRMAEYEQTGDEASKPHPVLAANIEQGNMGTRYAKVGTATLDDFLRNLETHGKRCVSLHAAASRL